MAGPDPSDPNLSGAKFALLVLGVMVFIILAVIFAPILVDQLVDEDQQPQPTPSVTSTT